MRKVFFQPAGKIHPSQYQLFDYPPEGYEFVLGSNKLDKVIKNPLMFNKIRLQVLDRLMPLNLVKAYLDILMVKLPENLDLLYTYNLISPRDIPYVVNVEWFHILSGRSPMWVDPTKWLVKKSLNSNNCKRILTWTWAARKSIIEGYDYEEFCEKIEVIPPAFPSRSFLKPQSDGKIRILFIGSMNQTGDFHEKGGGDILKVFETLRSEYPNIELTLRAKLPKGTRLVEGINLIENFLSKEELDNLYQISDIFFFPSHLFQNTVVIEAMSYGLPVITTSIGSSLGEYIKDRETGIVIDNLDSNNYFRKGFLVTETTGRSQLIRGAQDTSKKVLEELTYALESLIRNPQLRRKLGSNARQEVDSGRFSIESRNNKLKEIFDAACS